jgi:ribonuclease BN (tRNA processing enzyme)
LAQNPGFASNRLVLLGTRGGPFVSGLAPSPSANLLSYRGTNYMVDVGYGATLKLLQAGVSPAAIRRIYITHHHSDHNLELGPLLYNAWIAGLQSRVDVYGPRGLDALLSGFFSSNQFDIETRMADEGRPDLRTLVHSHEYAEGDLAGSDDVRVAALRNRHPPINDSFSLQFRFGGRKVVFSGDTAYFPPLATLARRADYLVHEIFYPPAIPTMLRNRPNAARLGTSIMSHHTSPEDVGRIAHEAEAKALVLTHFVPPDPGLVTSEMWLAGVRRTYQGPVIIGHDLLSLPL